MKKIKICPYCRKAFVTTANARKYCRKRCGIMANKYQKKKRDQHLCQWCGKVFTARRKRKFCDNACRSAYMVIVSTAFAVRTKKECPKIAEIERKSRQDGISYGKYVCIHKIR